MRRKGLARSAQYGQACISCSKAKCRCMLRSDGDGCERCHRLKKQCQPSEPHRRRADTDDPGRIALLEGRLEGLNSLLQARQDAESSTIDSSIEASDDVDLLGELDTFASSSEPIAATTTAVTTPSLHGSNPVTSPCTTTSEAPSLSPTSFDHFRTSMLPHFPFAHFPTDLTVERLCRDRPLLSQAIGVVTLPFSQERQTHADGLKRTLCNAAFLRPQHNGDSSGGVDPVVDLLLGLMTYIAWGWDHVNTRGSLSRLTMLCISLVGEMSLDRPAPSGLHTSNLLASNSQRRQTQTQLSPEQRRASLGCFIISSAVSAFFADIEPLQWSSQLEESLSIIDGANETPTDAELAMQVRLQLLSVKASNFRDSLLESDRNLHRDLTRFGRGFGESAAAAATVTEDAEALLARLQELRRASVWSFRRNQQVLLAHTYFAELTILETIRKSSFIASRVDGSITPPEGCMTEDGHPTTAYSDLSYMWQSVLALSACTSGFLSLPPAEFICISFLQWHQVASCVVILSTLECLQDPRINRPAARAVIDLPVFLDRLSEKLSLAAVETRDQRPDNVFAQLANSFRILRSNIQGPDVEVARPGPNDVSGCGPTSAATPPQQGYFRNTSFWMDQLFSG